jgi:casein kinase I homolog HRR25
MEWTFGGKYKLDAELGVGGCGSVYSGVHTIAGKEVAIKLEPAIPHPSYPSTHSASGSTPLQQESRIYKTLQGGPGVPWMMWSGKKDGWNVMVIDLLGPSLEDLFRRCNRHFSLKTVLLLADQMVSTMIIDMHIFVSPLLASVMHFSGVSILTHSPSAYAHRIHSLSRAHPP